MPNVLRGVNHVDAPHLPPAESESAWHALREMQSLGVRFGDIETFPWLVGSAPFRLPRYVWDRLQLAGEATFAFVDAVQQFYRDGEPVVRSTLDINTPNNLKGLQIERPIHTFRLDIILERGQPRITEIEEVYGNVGKLHAMEAAYGLRFDRLFENFAERKIEHIYVDDSVTNYSGELTLMRSRLKRSFGMDVPHTYFSAFDRNGQGRSAWRFCYTRDFSQYDQDHQHRIVGSDWNFTNPLFHGYGTKALLGLAYDEEIAPALRLHMGEALFSALRDAVPRCRMVKLNEDPRPLYALHKQGVLKIVDCPGHPQYAWGSRGVFFGLGARSRWQNTVDAAVAGSVVGRPDISGVAYVLSELVESDQFDVPFLHPVTHKIAIMPRARMRLAPIFFRNGSRVEQVGGHATFVNTSRKVHLGQHAVCVPIASPA
ncbi:hypothetical protein [Azospirillum agricola]|uniref:hypothetical protein n=1 Tax=Azospirillum agricola TaxID=1720247 RepID=UPI000A0F1B35|nr:hypothetical protein [Azospirillum agricola]SMH28499.1 hypothetical protein SAMN02982994_0041 [Azospirillum lipoferum]